MIDNNDSIWKIGLAGVTAFFSYIVYGVKQNGDKHVRHESRLDEHEVRLATIEEQLKHIISKLTDVVDLSNDLKQSSQTILRVLVRKSTK